MKPSLIYISSLVSFFFLNSVYAQYDSGHSRSKVIQQITDSLAAHSTYHYKAQMRFKEMGGDTFETRNFNISYKSDQQSTVWI
jgi:hypothetical protein